MDTRREPVIAGYLKGSFYWHIDGTMTRCRSWPLCSSSKKLASWGGNTGFCNTYAA